MARPLKQGLDYFPLDVDFLQDVKVRKIAKAQGTKSIPVLICLLSNIYRTDGYYLRWDGDMPFLIAEESGVEEGVVTEVLSKAQQVGFFDAEIFDTYRVLTSRGIQKRYFLAVKGAKRKEIAVVEDFLLLDPSNVPKNAVWYHAITAPKNGNLPTKIVSSGRNPVNSGRNPENSGNNPQSKVKYTSCCCYRESEGIDKDFAEVASLFSDNIHPISGEIERDMLSSLLQDFGKAWVLEAIKETALQHGRSVKYIGAILERWKEHGFKAPMGNGGKSRGRKGAASGNSRTGQGTIRDDAAKWQSETSGWD